MCELFQRFAHRYDLHTPPDHYQHDHAFVLGKIREAALDGNRLLDVGCGTGVFIEKALADGLDAYGTDAASGMVETAGSRLGPGRVKVERMQDLAAVADFDVVCALSWTIHYCEGADELLDVVGRCARALRSGGILILQVANAMAATGAVRVDREPGPGGEPDDTLFVHRFRQMDEEPNSLVADYIYASQVFGELLCEQHLLHCCDPELIAEMMCRSGLQDAVIVDETSISPFVVARMG